MTRRHFLMRSIGLCILMGVVVVVAWQLFGSKRQVANLLAEEVSQTELDRQKIDTYAKVSAVHSESQLAALMETLPDDRSIAQVFTYLEDEAALLGVEVRYNFGETSTTPSSGESGIFVIQVDFLGDSDQLVGLIGRLETGPYHIRIAELRVELALGIQAQARTVLEVVGRNRGTQP